MIFSRSVAVGGKRRVNHNHSIVVRYFIAMINFDFRNDFGAHVIRSFRNESDVIPKRNGNYDSPVLIIHFLS